MKQTRLDLLMPVRYAPGVGPRMAEKLARLGIETLEDLLRHCPRDWEDRRPLARLRDAKPGGKAAVLGTVQEVSFSETRSGWAIAQCRLKDESGTLDCKWMRRKSFQYDVFASLKKGLKAGLRVLAFGSVALDFGGKTLQVEEWEPFSETGAGIHLNRIVPIYPLTEGVRPQFLRELIHAVLSRTPAPDPLPASLLKEQDLPDLGWSLAKIHFPDNWEEQGRARRRLAFEELFLIQTVLAVARRRRRVRRGFRYEVRRHLLTPFREQCGFEFTAAQKRVIREIFDDLGSEFPMNRLLQGDVGSGKTVVALSALLLACENARQCALMAPTEILAEQHFITLRQFLKGLPVRVELLTGSLPRADRQERLDRIARGETDIVIGTHALLEKDVRFARLGLAVIDEQHRFGVKHRLLLTRRRPIPDVLVMTATPIPRTLALGLYGDLDVSTLDELPPGRRPVETRLASEAEATAAIARETEGGRQCYVVVPRVKEDRSSPEEDGEGAELLPALELDTRPARKLASAVQIHKKLQAKVFPGIPVGLLHGQLPAAEKERVMLDFKAGRFPVLVATTVVEVGIDVPNASLIAVLDAERFGLSTLHQLRGRVGRGQIPSRCLLVGAPRTESAQERLKIMAATQNGFELAERDLALRGPGEIFGTTQHGMPALKFADFSRDLELIRSSQRAARRLIEEDPDLAAPAQQALRETLRRRFSRTWFWANIL